MNNFPAFTVSASSPLLVNNNDDSEIFQNFDANASFLPAHATHIQFSTLWDVPKTQPIFALYSTAKESFPLETSSLAVLYNKRVVKFSSCARLPLFTTKFFCYLIKVLSWGRLHCESPQCKFSIFFPPFFMRLMNCKKLPPHGWS